MRVITFKSNRFADLHPWRQHCTESVTVALPPGMEYVILETPNDIEFYTFSMHSLLSDDVVMLVDEDDYISVNSISYCLQALKDTGSGISFTNEVLITTNNQMIPRPAPVLTYNEMYRNRGLVHHLVALDVSALDARAIKLAELYPSLATWIFYINAAINKGAIHVPIDGYFWRQHSDQLHNREQKTKSIQLAVNAVKKEITAWGGRVGNIPVWNNF